MQALTKKKRILDNITQQNLQLPYMKLLTKVHKLDHSVSRTNLHKLTGRPIITAHGWITSNPSRLLGTKLDSIISRLERFLFLTFPLIYNSTDLIDKLQDVNIATLYNYRLTTFTTFDFTSLYTNISYHDATHAIVTSCKLLNLANSYRDFLLNLSNFVNNRNSF